MHEVKIGKLAEFAEGDYRILAIDGVQVGVFNRGPNLVAYENRCPHMGGPVCQGKLFNRVEEVLSGDQKSRGLRFAGDRHIVCPWHGYEFNLDTGIHPAGEKLKLRRIDIEVRGDDVVLHLPDQPTKVGVPMVRSMS